MVTKDNFKVYSSLFEEINKALGYDEKSYTQVYYKDAADYADDTRDVYVAVFDEFGAVLSYEKAPEIYDASLSYFVEVFGISDIDDYFMELENIKQYVVGSGDISNPDNDPYFLILPQDDEPVFDIDANTRKITVPSEFSKNGIAVQGDELAEIVYFAIDRYFDTTDLYEKDILIQWEGPIKAGQMEPKKGLSVTVNKSLALIPGKVVFGWPITSDITETAGNVKFAVRFYDRIKDEVTKKEMLAYSFSTLTATAKINTALDFQIADSEAITALIVDKNKLIYDNLRNSSAEGVDVTAAAPTFVDAAFDPAQTYIDVDGTYVNVYDLSDTLKFIGRAAFTEEDDVEGFGTISYRWLRKVQKKQTDELQEFEIEDIPEYIPYEGNQKHNYDAYYYKPADKYIPYLGQIPTDDFTIYQRYATCYPTAAGEYYLIANNNAGRGNNKSVTTKAYWKVPFAAEPQFTYPLVDVTTEDGETIQEERRNIIMRAADADDNNAPYADLQMGVTVTDNGILTHQWYYSSSHVEVPSTGLNDSNKLTDKTGLLLEKVKNEGYYYLYSQNDKNADTTAVFSKEVRVTRPAQQVKISAYLIDGTTQPGVTSAGLDVYLNGTTKTIGVLVNQEGIPTDGVTYQWYDNKGIIDGATSSTYTITDFGRRYYVVVTNSYNTDTITDTSYMFNALE